MSRKNRAFLLIVLALVILVLTLTGCGEPKGHLKGTLSYENTDTKEAGFVNHAQVTMHGTGLPVRSAFSDANGQYRISDILVGKYEVVANFATATNLSDFEFLTDIYWGKYSLNNGANEYCDLTGSCPNLSLSLGDVVIADDTTTTLDFFLYGY